MWYDKEQFRRDCYKIVSIYGKRKQHGYFTIQEFRENDFMIRSCPFEARIKITWKGVPIISVRMGKPLANFILNKIIQWEES